MTTGQRVLVVGAAMAGLRTAESLRAAGHEGEIVLVGDEPHLPYTRPPLSKALLLERPEHAAVEFRRRPSVEDVDWRLGRHVESADLDRRLARLDDGTQIEWDALVAATGVRSRRLAAPGPTAGRHTVRTLADATALHDDLAAGARVVIIGAGFIGCEVAATAVTLGCEVTVVAADVEPMARPLGLELGAALRRRHERRGVGFRLGTGITRFVGDDRVTAVELDDGSVLSADVVIEAVGSTCNTEWLAGHGLDLSDGVLTDATFRVDHPSLVVAVGDVARYPNHLFDDVPRRIEHWQLATDTARTAAATVVAELTGSEPPAAFSTLPYFWTDQHDLKLQAFGAPGLATRTELLEGDLDDDCAIAYLRDETLVAVVICGMPKRAVHHRKAVMSALATSV